MVSSWGARAFFIENEAEPSAMDCIFGRLGVGGLETDALVLDAALLFI